MAWSGVKPEPCSLVSCSKSPSRLNDIASRYDCAASAAFRDGNKLLLRVQIIDRYLGNMFARFTFKNGIASVTLTKTAEAFLDEYQGEFVARLKD